MTGTFGTSPEDLTYTHFLERISIGASGTNRVSREYTKNETTWMPDSAASKCCACRKPFGWFRGRHHCRFCRKIYCADECSNFMVIPTRLVAVSTEPQTWLETITAKFATQPKVRVCDACYAYLTALECLELDVLILTFLDLQMVSRLACVNKRWSKAAGCYRTMLREIENVLVGYEYSCPQKRILWNNRVHFAGHSAWLVKLISSLSMTSAESQDFVVVNSMSASIIEEVERVIRMDRRVTCQTLRCHACCHRGMTGLDWIQVLDSKFCIDVIATGGALAEEILSSIGSITEFACFIPQLVFNLRYYKLPLLNSSDLATLTTSGNHLLDLLVSKSSDPELRVHIYWMFILLKCSDKSFVDFYNRYMIMLHVRLGKETVFNELVGGRRLVKFMCSLSENPKFQVDSTFSTFHLREYCDSTESETDDILHDFQTLCIRYHPSQPFQTQVCIRHPLNPQVRITNINAFGIRTKPSSTAPILIPCVCEDQTMSHLLYKKDSLIQDLLIINIIQLMDSILKRDLLTDFGIKIYRVRPLDRATGLIEMIPNAETLHNIRHEQNMTILNYLIEHNPATPSGELRERFIRSVASYCVISYLLGVGDRHLDNIMLTSQGNLFHIDYGFILGYDPRPITPSIRITQDILDALGGVNSNSYTMFKTYCSSIYTCLRKYTSTFMSMLLFLSEDGLNVDPSRYTKDRIRSEILARFLPSSNDADAEVQLHIKIDDSHSSYTPTVMIDWWHTAVKKAVFGSPPV